MSLWKLSGTASKNVYGQKTYLFLRNISNEIPRRASTGQLAAFIAPCTSYFVAHPALGGNQIVADPIRANQMKQTTDLISSE